MSEGEFFDLMYVSPASATFNPYRHYTFLRKAGKTLLLVVANFDEKEANVSVTIPAHAFDYLNIDEGNHKAKEMLTDMVSPVALTKDGSLQATVPAYGVAVYKITL